MGVRVLVVDDDPSLGRLFQLLGSDHPGITGVDVARDAATALDGGCRPAPDAIVLDADLRGVDGLGLIPTLHQTYEGAVIVVFSSAPYADPVSAARSGADAFLEKGTDPDAVLTRVIDLVRA